MFEAQGRGYQKSKTGMPVVPNSTNTSNYLKTIHKTFFKNYHVELVFVGDERWDGEGDEAAGGEREVRVDDGAVLVVLGRQGRVKRRPVQPQEHRAYNNGENIRKSTTTHR